jgi:hypothetical protein
MCGETAEGTGYLIPVYALFCGIAVVAVALRLLARVITQAYFWWDDLANLLSFVCILSGDVWLAVDTDSAPLGLRGAVHGDER